MLKLKNIVCSSVFAFLKVKGGRPMHREIKMVLQSGIAKGIAGELKKKMSYSGPQSGYKPFDDQIDTVLKTGC